MTQLSYIKGLFSTLIIFFMLSLFLLGCADLAKQSPFQFDTPEDTFENSSNTPDGMDDPLSADATDFHEPVSINDDDSNSIAYLPLIPIGDENCTTDSDTSDSDSISATIQAKLDEALDFYQASQDFWQQGRT